MAERRRLVAGDLEWINLPPEHWKSHVGRVPESVRGTVERYLARVSELVTKPVGLLLTGGPGVGKSAVAAIIAKEARAWERPTYFVSSSDFRDAVRAKNGFEPDVLLLKRLREVSLLVLDNVRPEDGAHAPSLRELEDLIEKRNAYKRATIVTTRMTAADFHSKGMSNLVTLCLATMVPLTVSGPDQRAANQAELRRQLGVSK